MKVGNRWDRKQAYKGRGRFEDSFDSTGCGKAVEIALDRIVLSDKNRRALRRDSGQIDRMRAVLESGGTLLPIKVCKCADGVFEIEDGRHRFLAHPEAGFRSINCLLS